MALLTDDLLLEVGALLVVLREADLVLPRTRILVGSEGDAKLHIGISPGGERAQCRDTVSFPDSVCESASHRHYVVQEPDRIQEIGLAGGVGSDEKRASREIDIDLVKVAPVAEAEVCDPRHRRTTGASRGGFGGHAGHSVRVPLPKWRLVDSRRGRSEAHHARQESPARERRLTYLQKETPL